MLDNMIWTISLEVNSSPQFEGLRELVTQWNTVQNRRNQEVGVLESVFLRVHCVALFVINIYLLVSRVCLLVPAFVAGLLVPCCSDVSNYCWVGVKAAITTIVLSAVGVFSLDTAVQLYNSGLQREFVRLREKDIC